MSILKNEKGGIGIVMALIPAVVIFLSFFMINSAVKQAAEMTKRQLELNNVEKIARQLAQQLYTGFVEGSPGPFGLPPNPLNCAGFGKANIPAPPNPLQNTAVPGISNAFNPPNYMVCVTPGAPAQNCVTDPTNPAQQYCMDNLLADLTPNSEGVYEIEVNAYGDIDQEKVFNAKLHRLMHKAGAQIASYTEKVVPEKVAQLFQIDLKMNPIKKAYAQSYSRRPPPPLAGDSDVGIDIPDCAAGVVPLDDGICFDCQNFNTWCFQMQICPPDQAPCGGATEFHHQRVVFRR